MRVRPIAARWISSSLRHHGVAPVPGDPPTLGVGSWGRSFETPTADAPPSSRRGPRRPGSRRPRANPDRARQRHLAAPRRSAGRAGSDAVSSLNNSWRVIDDVLDVGGEASAALATLTATALTALLAPPNHTTPTGVPDLVGGLDRHPSRPGGDIVAMPSAVSRHARPAARPRACAGERGAETVAAVVLHAAARSRWAPPPPSPHRCKPPPGRRPGPCAPALPPPTRYPTRSVPPPMPPTSPRHGSSGGPTPSPTPVATSTPGSPAAAPRQATRHRPHHARATRGPVTKTAGSGGPGGRGGG